MTGRHESPPVGSAAREATATPYIGKRRAKPKQLPDWPGRWAALQSSIINMRETSLRFAESMGDDPVICSGYYAQHEALSIVLNEMDAIERSQP